MANKFYHFSQNNSGGVHHESHGICQHVIVEARDYEDANALAQRIGIYFNGCDDHSDCPCCGDRWSAQWRGENGSDKPQVYGSVIESGAKRDINALGNIDWTDYYVWIHYLDGRVEGFKWVNNTLENVVDADQEPEIAARPKRKALKK